MKKLVLLLLVSLCLGSLGGCVHYGQFRNDTLKKGASPQTSPTPFKLCNDDPNADPAHKSVWCPEGKSKYYLGFVEVDDFGEMFDRRQLTHVQQLIQKAKADSPTVDGNCSPTHNALVVVFIHGWKNNASDGSGNVWGFRDELNDIAGALPEVTPKCQGQKQPDQKEGPMPVVGIYIGWRGQVTNLGLASQLTFYNRQDAAIRLPGAHLTEVLYEIMNETKSCLGGCKEAARPGTGSVAVIVGHSFGGQVLERTMTQAVAARVLDQVAEKKSREARGEKWTGGNLPLPVDLIVLVNEAAPATESRQLLDLLRHYQFRLCAEADPNPDSNRCKENRPLFLSITSTGDWATGLALPIAQGGSSLIRRNFQTYHNPKCTDPEHKGPNCKEPDPKAVPIPGQRTWYLHSSAHLPPLFSHVLGPADDPKIKQWVDDAHQHGRGADVHLFCIGKDNPKDAEECAKENGKEYAIAPLLDVYNDTPYWIMQMGTEFVPDHSQIFRPAFRQLLKQFILRRLDITQPGTPVKPAIMQIGPPTSAPSQ